MKTGLKTGMKLWDNHPAPIVKPFVVIIDASRGWPPKVSFKPITGLTCSIIKK